MLEKIKRLISYCEQLDRHVPDIPHPLLVATEDHGTVVLNTPKLGPRQVVIALPQASLSGGADHIAGPHTIIIFVLEKGKQQTATPERSTHLYMATADALEKILDRFRRDICDPDPSGGCPLLCGMELVEVEVLPESGRFGGWDGWSATLTLK